MGLRVSDLGPRMGFARILEAGDERRDREDETGAVDSWRCRPSSGYIAGGPQAVADTEPVFCERCDGNPMRRSDGWTAHGGEEGDRWRQVHPVSYPGPDRGKNGTRHAGKPADDS